MNISYQNNMENQKRPTKTHSVWHIAKPKTEIAIDATQDTAVTAKVTTKKANGFATNTGGDDYSGKEMD